MSDTKISALPSASSLTGAERLPVSQSNQTRGATAAQILSSSLFTQTGTGAVARSINSRFQETIFAGDFGTIDTTGASDASAIIQKAINAARTAGGNMNILLPAGSLLINAALDITNCASIGLVGAGPNISPPVSQTDAGATTLMLNTGGVGIDTTGSTATQLRNFQCRVLNSYSNPSKVSILMGRSSSNHSAQFHNYENIWIYMESSAAVTARGRVGIYNVCAEHWLMRNSFLRTDAPIVLATTDVLSVPSPYQGALFTSTMTFVNHLNVACITQGSSFYGLECFGGVSQIDLFNPYFSSAGAAPTAAMTFNGASNIINIHDIEIEAMAFVMNIGASMTALSLTGQIATYGTVTPQAHVQFSANTLTLSRAFIRLRQNDGTKQLLFNANATETVTESILHLGTTGGITTLKLSGCHVLTDDATNSTVSSLASGSTYILQYPAGNAIVGTTTNDNAGAGIVGEYQTTAVATGSSQSLTSPNALNVTSVSLTAGDWDVWGVVDYTAGGGTTFTVMKQGISTTSATIGGQDTFTNLALAGTLAAASDLCQATPVVRLSLSAASTTVFLVAQVTFAVSTLKAYGSIFARRVR